MKLDQPAWLILLVLPPLVALAAWLAGRARKRQWAAFVAERLRPTLVKGESPLPRWFALSALLAAIILLIAALARPYAESGTRSERMLGRNVLFAMDVSRSMRVADVKPDRLAQSKIVAYELIDSMPSERIGLIAFAGEAYLCAPLTIDHHALRETIDQLDESWVTLGGSNLTRAVKLAIENLRETGQRNNALVILSDGEKHEPNLDDAIIAANQAGVFVIAIGVGTEDGDYVPHPDAPGQRMTDGGGKPVLSRLQADNLRRLASETGGKFAIAGSGSDIASLVRSTINELEAFEIEGRERTVKAEFYQWLALPAAVLLTFSIIAGTRWRRITPHAAVAALAILTSIPVQAASPADARAALASGDHEKAAAIYQDLSESATTATRRAGFRLGEATAAYRAADFRRARSAYSAALLSPDAAVTREAHLGMGNTLFQSGWKSLSGKPHPAAPQNPGTMEEFDTLARKLLQSGGGADEQEESDGEAASNRIRFIIRHWTDAVRHYDTILTGSAGHPEASANRELTLRYLRRLAELMKEEEEKTQQSLPEPSPDGEPNPEGDQNKKDGDGDCENEGGNQPKPDSQEGGKQNDPNARKRDGDPSGESEKSEQHDPDAPRQPNQKPPSDEGERQPSKSDESPQERARRLLLENADTERGPLTPGRFEFRQPEKDW